MTIINSNNITCYGKIAEQVIDHGITKIKMQNGLNIIYLLPSRFLANQWVAIEGSVKNHRKKKLIPCTHCYNDVYVSKQDFYILAKTVIPIEPRVDLCYIQIHGMVLNAPVYHEKQARYLLQVDDNIFSVKSYNLKAWKDGIYIRAKDTVFTEGDFFVKTVLSKDTCDVCGQTTLFWEHYGEVYCNKSVIKFDYYKML